MATKQKTDSVRTYDQDGYRRRAACVCIRDHSQKEVLLVSTNHDPDLWIVPGGGVEPTERVEEAAVREVLEEAGVKGTIAGCLGLFESIECNHRTMVYLMVVHELLSEWQEALSIGRRRRWFTMEEARTHLDQHRPSHSRYLDNLKSSDITTPAASLSTAATAGANSRNEVKSNNNGSNCNETSIIAEGNNGHSIPANTTFNTVNTPTNTANNNNNKSSTNPNTAIAVSNNLTTISKNPTANSSITTITSTPSTLIKNTNALNANTSTLDAVNSDQDQE